MNGIFNRKKEDVLGILELYRQFSQGYDIFADFAIEDINKVFYCKI
ncbi:hypothetical protein FACS1894172_16780 [Spirochaetia bacterium]|nr:hypothetical protein FACS1894172_16780 [Spirochaetia bacterium]